MGFFSDRVYEHLVGVDVDMASVFRVIHGYIRTGSAFVNGSVANTSGTYTVRAQHAIASGVCETVESLTQIYSQ